MEDNPANLELVEQLMARRPELRLLGAADGNLGIEFARAYLPEVILMDINLPGISGIEAMKILRADPSTAHIPIIALSANAVPRDIEKGLEAGFFSYLTKPIKVNQFMDALDVALKFSQAASGRKPQRSSHDVSESEILDASILIVDDQEANVSLLEQMLREAGYARVASTTDPQEVCALHRKNHYDLILLDLQMPGMDGFQVMEGLKTSDADSYLPVLVITAQPGHKLRALQAGARDFVSKPFDLVEVKTRIRNMLEVRLLYRKLQSYSSELERTVRGTDCGAARKRGALSQPDRTGLRLVLGAGREREFHEGFGAGPRDARDSGRRPWSGEARSETGDGWNEAERKNCRRPSPPGEPFLDFVFSRVNADGSRRQFQVSGEPMFNQSCRFIGYRGIGVELTSGISAPSRRQPCHPRTSQQNHLLAAMPAPEFERLARASGTGADAARRNPLRSRRTVAARLFPDHGHRVAALCARVRRIGRNRGRGQ